MMQRRHFVRIAAAMRDVLDEAKMTDPQENGVLASGVESAIVAIANVCYDSNARFDYDVFYRACGLEVS